MKDLIIIQEIGYYCYGPQDRRNLLQILSIWSQITSNNQNLECKKIIASIKSNRKKYKDKELDRKEKKNQSSNQTN